MPTIPIFTRRRCGNLDTWPADAAHARHLHALTGCLTLSTAHLEALTALGFTFRQVADPKASPCIVPLTTPSQLEHDTA